MRTWHRSFGCVVLLDLVLASSLQTGRRCNHLQLQSHPATVRRKDDSLTVVVVIFHWKVLRRAASTGSMQDGQIKDLMSQSSIQVTW